MAQYTADQVKGIIAKEAQAAGVDVATFMAFAHIETGGTFNPNARNKKSGASGLFQFMPQYFSSYGLNSSSVFDPVANTRAAIKMYKDNAAQFRKKYGRDPNAAEAYLMHQQGFGGLNKLASNRGKRLSQLGGQAVANANANGGNSNMTAGQFLDMWAEKANSLKNTYGGRAGATTPASAAMAIGNAVVDAASGGKQISAGFKDGDPRDFEFNPLPWDEDLQSKLRIENMVRDFSVGAQRLIPTYKIYIVYSNNENHIERLVDKNMTPKYYEVPAARNIHIEMASMDNPVSVAYFEVLNSMNTATMPTENRPTGANPSREDIRAIGSGFENVFVYDQIRLKAGNNIQIRMGYGNDPNKLECVFNGVITESDGGDILQVTAEGYGREYVNRVLYNEENSWLSAAFNEQFISEHLAVLIKNADVEHFGRTPRWFESREDNGEQVAVENTGATASSKDGAGDKGGVNGMNFSLSNNALWDSSKGQFFWADISGPSETLENYYLSNLDVITAYWGEGTALDALPFSTRNFFQTFRVSNKTLWDACHSARRCFPSAIQLIRPLGARATFFSGIKEQNIIGKKIGATLLKLTNRNYGKTDYTEKSKTKEGLRRAEEALYGGGSRAANDSIDLKDESVNKESRIDKALKAGTRAAQRALGTTSAGGKLALKGAAALTPSESTVKKARDITSDSIKQSYETNLELSKLAKDFNSIPDDAWQPATNFHILSSSHNIISNQMKLNASAYTGVRVEYGEEPEKFGTGTLKVFDLTVNGGLLKSSILERMHIDNSVDSENMAMRTAQSVVIEELEKMYGGAIIISGNPYIQPGDYASIVDHSRGMTGVIKCREVQHIFSEQDGFITIITPGMFVEPATHLFSLLYMKLSIFTSFVQEIITENRIVSVGGGGISGAFSKALMAQEITSANALFAEGLAYVTTGALAARQVAAIGASGLQRFAGSVWGTRTALTTVRAAGVVRNFGVSLKAAKTLQATRTVKLVASGLRIARVGIGAINGVLASTPVTWPALVVFAIIQLAWGMAGNFLETWVTTRTLKHKAILKFPVFVNGKEYVAGLNAWNDDKGIFELQFEQLKTTMSNLGILSDAVGDAYDEGGFRSATSLGWRLISD